MKTSVQITRPSLLHLSVEEENLASIPFAVLERRVGRRDRIELQGTKILPDGTELHVSWQVQGNAELGLPTEQDLDIFIALGVLTFQNDFAKTVTFTGREIAGILGIQSVHGKFYQRLKMAMDRFIPLRFRGVAESERQEEIKWLNIFQEASFSLDRETGRCVGSVTWTDKLIQSMNSGFFRVLDASRYMELDGITAKHMYRFLAVAFEKADFIVMDARKLATEHLGILNPPKYLSRLMQTLEPAFDQLIRIQVLGAYHVVDSGKWDIALHRHASYVPERKLLVSAEPAGSRELNQVCCRKRLEKAGLPERAALACTEAAETLLEFYQLDRAARLLEALQEEGVLPHVAVALIRRGLEAGAGKESGIGILDGCEIALDICRQKKASRQNVRNLPGLLVRIAKDPCAVPKIVSKESLEAARTAYRQREASVLAQHQLAEQKALLMEYEQYREQTAQTLFQELPESSRAAFRKEKVAMLKQQGRYEKMEPAARDEYIEEMICRDIARRQVAPFERWYARKRARQAVLPFGAASAVSVAAR
jgi:hypothetical protein